MARRSPMNNRYQKGTTPKGVSRKSAASAKPKRAVGEQASSSGKSRADYKKKGRQAKGQAADSSKSSFLRETPDSLEFKQNRKVWWYCLGASFVLLIVSLALGLEQVREFLNLEPSLAQSISVPMTFAAMLMVAYAWYIDLKKIRPMQREFDAERGLGPAVKTDKAETDKKDKDETKSKSKGEDKGSKDGDDSVGTDKKSAKKKKAEKDSTDEDESSDEDAGEDKDKDKNKKSSKAKGSKSGDEGKKSSKVKKPKDDDGTDIQPDDKSDAEDKDKSDDKSDGDEADDKSDAETRDESVYKSRKDRKAQESKKAKAGNKKSKKNTKDKD